MPTLDIFNTDAFSCSSLTASINEQPYAPGRIGELGLFEEESIATTSIQVEKGADILSLVPNKPRGAGGEPVTRSRGQILSFAAVHLPQEASIEADEVQNVRAFGSETELATVQSIVNQRLATMRRNLDATVEFHRLGAIKGLILDVNGDTILDLYSSFGITQTTISLALGTATTEVQTKCLDVLESIEDALGAASFSDVRVFCGKTFWRQLIIHPKVKEAYGDAERAARLAGDPRIALRFGELVFERYRGSGQVSVADGEAYAVPEGVPQLLITRHCPANYTEAANTLGRPYYAKVEPKRFGKGVDLEAQASPINLCTRPKAIIKLTA